MIRGYSKNNETWCVSVERNGRNILTISHNCVSGKTLGAEDEQRIRECARHLLAFVGESVEDKP